MKQKLTCKRVEAKGTFFDNVPSPYAIRYTGYGGMEVQFHALTSALDGSEWLCLRSGRFTPRKNSGTHRVGGWCDPEPV